MPQKSASIEKKFQINPALGFFVISLKDYVLVVATGEIGKYSQNGS